MQLKLKWRNPNTIPVSVSIYRNNTAVSIAELGEPLVTLPGSTVEWIDKTVLMGKDYFYRWKVTGDTETVYSQPYQANTAPYTGPGPAVLQFGSNALGYFGTVGWDALFSTDELKVVTGLSINSSSIVQPNWHKWIRNGKILFVPDRQLGNVGSVSLVYNKGLMFGTDDNGPYLPANATACNQRTVITKGFHNFIVRLPTGLDDRSGVLGESQLADTDISRRYSEFSDIIAPLCAVPLLYGQRIPSFLPSHTPLWMANGLNNHCACQEKQLTATAGYGTMAGAYFRNQTDYALVYPRGYSLTTQTIAYYPVLELIPNDLLEVTL